MTRRRFRLLAAEGVESLRRRFLASPAEVLALSAFVALLLALSLVGMWRWHFA